MKYRYRVLTDDVGLRVRELTRQTCEHLEIEILLDVVSQDHVHLLVSAPPNISPSEIMRRIKVRTSTKLFQELTKEMIKEYLEHYFEHKPNGNFEVE